MIFKSHATHAQSTRHDQASCGKCIDVLGSPWIHPHEEILMQTYSHRFDSRLIHVIMRPLSIFPPRVRCGRARSAKLARVIPPAVELLPVPLIWQQDKPLLARHLPKLGVRVPRPEQRTRR
eukprot:5615510-Prymnesium_polylepis.1